MLKQFKLFRIPRISNEYMFYSKENKNITNSSKENSEEVTKDSLQWRTPWAEKKDEWYSKLKVFGSDHNNADVVKFLQSPINLTPTSIKNWWNRNKLEKEICLQQYIPERNKILGDDLAAAHFIVHRGGSIKFAGQNDWVKQDENLNYKLPTKYVPNIFVEAIDCSNMRLHFEGLANISGLRKLEWLNISNSKYIDDWCLDRICGMYYDGNLKHLDIRNCPKISDRGIGALHKIKSLRTLYIDSSKENNSIELTCLMLMDLLPQLEIKS